jgi:Effector-associated domain 7
MNYSDLGKIRQLIQDALELENLLNLCIDEFKPVYDNFKNQGRDCIVRELVDYAYRNNEVDVLLVLIEKINPNIYQQFKLGNAQNRSPQQHSILHSFPATSNFDLIEIIEQCRREIIDKKGLIGLSICCSDNSFLKNFCERLKQKSRGNIQIRQTISIKPQVSSVKRAVESIGKYKQVLNNSDVVCPIRIDVENPNSNIIKDFWVEVQDIIGSGFDRRLIIIMIGSQDCLFPSDVFSLPPPQFNKVHVTDWISDLILSLHGMQTMNGWEDVADIWIDKMHEHCQCDDPHTEIGLVYEHLDFILSELNWLREKPAMSPQDFLQRIYL